MVHRSQAGLTLLEILLVVAIMVSMTLIVINYTNQHINQFRREQTARQINEILNAGLRFYADYGYWPTNDFSANYSNHYYGTFLLQDKGYLPIGPVVDSNSPNYRHGGDYIKYGQLAHPWNVVLDYGRTYTLYSANDSQWWAPPYTPYGSNFMVGLSVPTVADAKVIAGMIPMGNYQLYDEPATHFMGFVWGQVIAPKQSASNARAVNFAGVYNSGACVAIPTCPSGMTAKIVVAPTGVRGVNDPPTHNGATPCNSTVYSATGTPTVPSNSCNEINAYALTGYIATATGGPNDTSTIGPPNCDGSLPSSASCNIDAAYTGAWVPEPTGKFWRVCLLVQTKNGKVTITGSPNAAPAGSSSLYWAQALGQVMAITRCVPDDEPAGSSLNIWGI